MKFCPNPNCEMHMKRKGDFWECKNCNTIQNLSGEIIQRGSPKKPLVPPIKYNKKNQIEQDFIAQENLRYKTEKSKIEDRKQHYQQIGIPDFEKCLEQIADYQQSSVRDVQREIMRKISSAIKQGYNKIIISAPTGSGKSWIAAALALAYKSAVILTSTTNLQDQYKELFAKDSKFMTTVRGRSHFPCEQQYRLKDCTFGYCSNCEFKPLSEMYKIDPITQGTIDESIIITPTKDKKCEYFEQLIKGRQSSFSVYNYASYITSLKKESTSIGSALEEEKLPHRSILICDEMHDYDDQLANILSVNLEPDLDKTILKTESSIFNENNDIYAVKEHLDKIIDALPQVLNEYSECSKHTTELLSRDHIRKHCVPCSLHDLKIQKNCAGCTNIRAFIERKQYLQCKAHTTCSKDHSKFNHERMKKLQQYYVDLKFIHYGLSEYPLNYVINNEKNGNLKIMPLNSNWMSRKLFEKFDTIFFMSATANKKLFCLETRFREDEVAFVEVDSEIPVQNRKITFLNTATFGHNDENVNWKKITDEIQTIMSKYENKRGIIMTTSYIVMHKILKHIDSSFKKRLLPTHRKVDDETKICEDCNYPMKYKNTVLEEHKRDESYNSVLISPALGTGVDLPDELSRFQIIVKTPYLDNEHDKRIKKIFEIQPDRYFLKSVFTFVQNAGRSIRSKTDYAETFVLDTRIHQLLNYQRNQLPKWFLESINYNFSN